MKMENPTYTFRETLCFSSYKNRELKLKLWLVGVRGKERVHFCITLILPEGYLFNICVISQCTVYWRNFQNTHSFTYQKNLLHTPFLLVFKIVESLEYVGIIISRSKYIFEKCLDFCKNVFPSANIIYNQSLCPN